MRASEIKRKYLSMMNGDKPLWIDNGQFDCGNHIAYEMEMDFKAMKFSVHLIEEFIKYSNAPNHGKLETVLESLKERITLGFEQVKKLSAENSGQTGDWISNTDW